MYWVEFGKKTLSGRSFDSELHLLGISRSHQRSVVPLTAALHSLLAGVDQVTSSNKRIRHSFHVAAIIIQGRQNPKKNTHRIQDKTAPEKPR
jgi:hypothetical protein